MLDGSRRDDSRWERRRGTALMLLGELEEDGVVIEEEPGGFFLAEG